MPGRGGPATAGAVRHRTRRPPGRLRPGEPGDHGRAAAGPGTGQGPRRGRLVQTAAARRVAQLRRTGRGTAHRAARGDRRDPDRAGQNRLGRTGIRIPADLRGPGRADHPPRPLAAHVRHPQSARSPRTGRRAGVVDDPGPHRPAPRHRTAPHPAGFGHHRRRAHRPQDRRRTGRIARVRRAQPAAQRLDVALGARGCAAEPGPAGGQRGRQRPAAAGAVEPAQTRRGRPTGGGAGGAGGVVRAGAYSGGEPGRARSGAEAVLGVGDPRAATGAGHDRSGGDHRRVSARRTGADWQRELVVPALAAAVAFPVTVDECAAAGDVNPGARAPRSRQPNFPGPQPNP